MPFQVPLSIAGNRSAFASAVADHRERLIAHQQGEPGIAAPRADEWVEKAVRRVADDNPDVAARGPDQFVIDYEIIDDSAPPPTLMERKAKLLGEVARLRDDEIAKIISPARLALLQMDVSDAGFVAADKRTPEQVNTMKRWEEFAAARKVIERRALERKVEIEDLTEVAIDGFSLKF